MVSTNFNTTHTNVKPNQVVLNHETGSKMPTPLINQVCVLPWGFPTQPWGAVADLFAADDLCAVVMLICRHLMVFGTVWRNCVMSRMIIAKHVWKKPGSERSSCKARARVVWHAAVARAKHMRDVEARHKRSSLSGTRRRGKKVFDKRFALVWEVGWIKLRHDDSAKTK